MTPFPSEEELRRREGDRPYADLPEGSGETWYDVLPTDRLDYEAFVQFVLRSATNVISGEGEARPFQSGLRDGIDVRATLRHWHEGGDLYIRESSREKVPVTNAVIDFEGAGESSAFLRGEPPVAVDPSQRTFWPVDESTGVVMPWTESSRLRVAASRACAGRTRPSSSARSVQRLHRGLSFVSLDRANEEPAGKFFSQVINPLLELAYERDRDHLENWLRVFFRFARGKPVAYFSRYVPGARIHAVARQYGVRVQHVPLDRIPAELRERNQTFRIGDQNDEQWEVLRQRIAERKGARGASAVVTGARI